jgi:hypothetical protein
LALLVRFSFLIFRRFSFCAIAGSTVGSLAGLILGILQTEFSGVAWQDITLVAALLAAFCWVVLMLIAGIWLNYGVLSIALPSLVNAIITTLAVAYANNLLGQPILAPLIGTLLGLLIGSLLCMLCSTVMRPRANHRRGH